MARNRLFMMVLVTGMVLSAAPGWSGEKPFWIVPDKTVDPRLHLEEDTWILQFSGLEIRTRFLDPESTQAFLETRAPGQENPFAPDGLFPEQHFLFQLEMRNRSDQTVTFHPGNIVMITNKNEQEMPLEYSDFYRKLAYTNIPPEKFLRDWTRVYYDGSHSLKPGESTSKLLAYRAPRQKWKRLMLYISFMQIGSENHSFQFPFSRTRDKKSAPMPVLEDDDRGDPS